MLEIEVKIRVDELGPVRSRLIEAGASGPERAHERDIYYNASDRDFARTDEALRIRYSGDHCVLTYKGAKLTGYSAKAREELSTSVESGLVLEQILERLGFQRTAEVEKTREYYRFRNASVALDEVKGLGEFVEIERCTIGEGHDLQREIVEIARELGIHGEPIRSSYLELLQSIQKAA
jgi:adenylate cyclase class 2